VFEIIFINSIKTKRASFPTFLFLILKVLEHARPAVNVATLGDPGADHICEWLHANRALDIR
jgi:hypothetical protein